MAELGSPMFDARGDQGQGPDELGVQVPLNHLGGDGGRTQTELLTNRRFNARGEVSARADCSRQFADCYCVANIFETLQRAAKLVVHQCHLQPESGWFGVNSMAAADHWGELMLLSLGRDGCAKLNSVL